MAMTLLQAPPLPLMDPLVLHGVTWSTYTALRDEIDEHGQRLYMTYDSGVLEIMPPLPIHDRVKMVVHDLIVLMSDQWEIDLVPMGSTTYRREALAKGIEPDQCYFIAHASEARQAKFDPTSGPVPDLALEVDITRHSIARQPIYAALGVAELWRYGNAGLSFLSLDPGGQYVPIARSIAFPAVAPSDLERFIDRFDSMTSPEFRKAFRHWLSGISR